MPFARGSSHAMMRGGVRAQWCASRPGGRCPPRTELNRLYSSRRCREKIVEQSPYATLRLPRPPLMKRVCYGFERLAHHTVIVGEARRANVTCSNVFSVAEAQDGSFAAPVSRLKRRR